MPAAPMFIANPTPIMVNPPTQSTLIMVPKKPTNTFNINSLQPDIAMKLSSNGDRTLSTLRPKIGLTKTTQVNKVPIPALTSRYANCFTLLSSLNPEVKNTKAKSNHKKLTKKSKVEAVENNVGETKKTCDVKAPTAKCGSSEKKINEQPEIVQVDNSPVDKQEKLTSDSIENIDDGKRKLESNESKNLKKVCLDDEIKQPLRKLVVSTYSIDSLCKESSVVYTSNTKPLENITSPSLQVSNEVNVSVATEVPVSNTNTEKLPLTLLNTSKETRSGTDKGDQVIKKKASTTKFDDDSKLNGKYVGAVEQLTHSDLPDDIFASLDQVPAGSQNPESTSPTAAFLLAFPLVTSMTSLKVTEVMEDETCESRHGTPTLLQIGTMEPTKTTQSHSESLTPNLLNLDNFSFFSSREMYNQCYPGLDSVPVTNSTSNVTTFTTQPHVNSSVPPVCSSHVEVNVTTATSENLKQTHQNPRSDNLTQLNHSSSDLKQSHHFTPSGNSMQITSNLIFPDNLTGAIKHNLNGFDPPQINPDLNSSRGLPQMNQNLTSINTLMPMNVNLTETNSSQVTRSFNSSTSFDKTTHTTSNVTSSVEPIVKNSCLSSSVNSNRIDLSMNSENWLGINSNMGSGKITQATPTNAVCVSLSENWIPMNYDTSSVTATQMVHGKSNVNSIQSGKIFPDNSTQVSAYPYQTYPINFPMPSNVPPGNSIKLHSSTASSNSVILTTSVNSSINLSHMKTMTSVTNSIYNNVCITSANIAQPKPSGTSINSLPINVKMPPSVDVQQGQKNTSSVNAIVTSCNMKYINSVTSSSSDLTPKTSTISSYVNSNLNTITTTFNLNKINPVITASINLTEYKPYTMSSSNLNKPYPSITKVKSSENNAVDATQRNQNMSTTLFPTKSNVNVSSAITIPIMSTSNLTQIYPSNSLTNGSQINSNVIATNNLPQLNQSSHFPVDFTHMSSKISCFENLGHVNTPASCTLTQTNINIPSMPETRSKNQNLPSIPNLMQPSKGATSRYSQVNSNLEIATTNLDRNLNPALMVLPMNNATIERSKKEYTNLTSISKSNPVRFEESIPQNQSLMLKQNSIVPPSSFALTPVTKTNSSYLVPLSNSLVNGRGEDNPLCLLPIEGTPIANDGKANGTQFQKNISSFNHNYPEVQVSKSNYMGSTKMSSNIYTSSSSYMFPQYNTFNPFTDVPKTSFVSVTKPYTDLTYSTSTSCTYGYDNVNSIINTKTMKNDKMYGLNYQNYDYRTEGGRTEQFSMYYDQNLQGSKEKLSTNEKNHNNVKQPVNWMTTPDPRQQTHGEFLVPSYNKDVDFSGPMYPNTFQSGVSTTYFNASANALYPTELHTEVRKFDNTLPTIPTSTFQKSDLEENQFPWSPSKLPQFFETAHNFVSGTLPTLVGDLALGNTQSTPSEQKVDRNVCKVKDRRSKTNTHFDTQNNFLSVSQLVDRNKESTTRVGNRRNSSSRSSKAQKQQKRIQQKTMDAQEMNNPVQNYASVKIHQSGEKHLKHQGSDYGNHRNETWTNNANNSTNNNPKSRSVNKNLTSYSAEALIGTQNNVDSPVKHKDQNYIVNKSLPPVSFLPDNIMPYFPSVEVSQDPGYIQQNQNFQAGSFNHNFAATFQGNSYPNNTFAPNAPTITSNYLATNFLPDIGTHDYNPIIPENSLHVVGGHHQGEKHFNSNQDKLLHGERVEEKRDHRVSNFTKKSSKRKHHNDPVPSYVDFGFLSMPGSVNSPVLSEDFHHPHSNFLPAPAPAQMYPCKNSLYSKQPSDLGTNVLLPFSTVKASVQNPEVSPSLNNVGNTLTNFNLSTIFPEINRVMIMCVVITWIYVVVFVYRFQELYLIYTMKKVNIRITGIVILGLILLR